jgi:hypothetical protein
VKDFVHQPQTSAKPQNVSGNRKCHDSDAKRQRRMKFIITIFTAFLFLSWIAPIDKELPQFRLTFISGCNAITNSKINVYIKENKYFADHISPTYFDGEKIDSLWTVELNQDQIDACIKFLNKAKSLPNKCDQFGSSENLHIIVIENDTIEINGDCNWENLDFHFLDRKLFVEKHLAIEERKKSFIDKLDKELSGKWYLQTLINDLHRSDLISFSKSKVTNNFIVFGDQNSLSGNCKDLLKMKDLKRYKTELSDGWNETVFTLEWGKVTLVKEYNTWYEFGATFTLESLHDDELKLKFQWTSN